LMEKYSVLLFKALCLHPSIVAMLKINMKMILSDFTFCFLDWVKVTCFQR